MSRQQYLAEYYASAPAPVAAVAVARAAGTLGSVSYAVVAIPAEGTAVAREPAVVGVCAVSLAPRAAGPGAVVSVSVTLSAAVGVAGASPVDALPAGPTFTQGVLASLRAWGGPGSAWYAWVSALGSMFEAVWAIVSNNGSPDIPETYQAGWSTLLNPATCPTQFLPFCAMFNGTRIPTGSTDAQARQIILSEAGFGRGTAKAIIGAANAWTTQPVTLLERQRIDGSPDAYHFVVVVVPESVISIPDLINAVNAVKPAGLQWDLLGQNGYIWEQQTREWVNDTRTWQQAFAHL